MFTTIGAVLAGSPPARARQPVRRSSRLAGSCEGTFWRGTSRQEVRRILLAARRYELVTRAPGRRTGALGHVALEVPELLGHLVSFRTGRLEPAILTIMGKIRRARGAVVRALAALRSHGFLDWLRRYEPTLVEGPGPQVRQVSNAYRLSLPPRAAQFLGVLVQDVPPPEDVGQAAREAREAIRASLTLGELPLVDVDDGPLARALGNLGRLVQERESTRGTEPPAKELRRD